MKKSTTLTAIVAILFTAAGVWFGTHRINPVAAEPAAVTNLFAQSLPALTDSPQALSQWRGRRLLVNFWATWCAPCVQEMPELSALQTELGVNSLQIVGIGIDSSANIKEFAKKLPVAYPLYVGGMDGSELARKFGDQSGSLPFTVLIDANGSIKKTYLGRLKLAELRQDLSDK